jgi:hypothetical protein
MTLTRTAARTIPVLLAALTVQPIVAQPVSTVAPAPTAAPAPPAWTVTADQPSRSVRIAATASDGAVRIVAACKAPEAGISGAIFGYQGGGLRTDGQVEAVTFFAEGAEWRDAFSVRLRYAAASRSWVLANPLSPIFLASFSRGATLTVVNSRNQEIFTFDLTGSTAATRAMRTTCGFS